MIRSGWIKRLVPAFLVTFVALVCACKMPTQQAAGAKTQDEGYPSRFTLIALPGGWGGDFGLHSLTSSVVLKGNLCWIGYRDKDALERIAGEPIIQRVSLQTGVASQVLNLQVPANDSKHMGFVGCPLFNRDINNCFFRVFPPASSFGEDEPYYDAFQLNFVTRKAVSADISLNSGDTLLPSSDGKFCVTGGYIANSGDYLVMEHIDGKTKVISQQLASKGFSLTSDNHLLLATLASNPDPSKNHGYPNIYENDLKGRVQLVKEGGFYPLFSPEKELLAYVGPDTISSSGQPSSADLAFYPRAVGKVAVFIYDRRQKKDFFVKRIYERYPDLRWVGDKLYVIENFYVFSKQTAVCRISEFDALSHTLKLLCKLEQKSSGPTLTEDDVLPRFEIVGVANKKYLLLQVPVKSSGIDNYHLLTVSLQSGVRSDTFSYTAPSVAEGIVDDPHIAWIEQK